MTDSASSNKDNAAVINIANVKTKTKTRDIGRMKDKFKTLDLIFPQAEVFFRSVQVV